MTEFATRAVHAGQDPTPPPAPSSAHPRHQHLRAGRRGATCGTATSTPAGATPRGTPCRPCSPTSTGRRGVLVRVRPAAEDALLRAYLEPGSRVVMGNDVYGGTHRLVNRLHVPWGVELVVVDMSDVDRVRAALEGAPAKTVLWVETPTKPAHEDRRHHAPVRGRARGRRARRRRQHLRLAVPAAAAVARCRRGVLLDDGSTWAATPTWSAVPSCCVTRSSPSRSASCSSVRARSARPSTRS